MYTGSACSQLCICTVYTHATIYVYLCLLISLCTYSRMYERMYVSIHVCMYVCKYSRMYVCLYVCTKLLWEAVEAKAGGGWEALTVINSWEKRSIPGHITHDRLAAAIHVLIGCYHLKFWFRLATLHPDWPQRLVLCGRGPPHVLILLRQIHFLITSDNLTIWVAAATLSLLAAGIHILTVCSPDLTSWLAQTSPQPHFLIANDHSPVHNTDSLWPHLYLTFWVVGTPPDSTSCLAVITLLADVLIGCQHIPSSNISTGWEHTTFSTYCLVITQRL